MRNSSRMPGLAILALLLLSVSAGLALPAPPETVVAAPFTPEGHGDQDGFILLSWDAVEGADVYRIWREVLVDRVLDEAGNTIELETP